MKTFTLALTLSLAATSSMAVGSFVAGPTPALTFPKDSAKMETVTKDARLVSN